MRRSWARWLLPVLLPLLAGGLVLGVATGRLALAPRVLALLVLFGTSAGLVVGLADRRASLRQLREKEHNHRELVEVADDLVCEVDREGRWTFLNRAATERLLGYVPEELLGHRFVELLPPEERERALAAFAHVLTGGQEIHYETILVRKDGSPAPVCFNAMPLRDLAGRVVGAMALASDASERKRVEGELTQRQCRLEILHQIAAGIHSRSSVEEVVTQAIQRIASQFPHLRAAYATIDRANRLRIVQANEPAGMPPLAGLSADLSPAPAYLAALRAGAVVAVPDVAVDPRFAPLAAAMQAGATRAVLDVPIRHSAEVVGLLCFDAAEVHVWSEHEIATLVEVGDYLTLAIRDVEEHEERRRAEALVEHQNHVLEQVARAQPLEESLVELARIVESQAPHLRCAVLLLDEHGARLEVAAAPDLGPLAQASLAATADLLASPWGAAVRHRDRVVTVLAGETPSDELPVPEPPSPEPRERLWVEPILAATGIVLGSLALVYTGEHEPGANEHRLVSSAVDLAAVAIEAARSRQHWVHNALHDSLTGLANRALFVDRLGMAMKRTRHRGTSRFAVLFIDLDRFKLVNDSLGHMLGDELLERIGQRLKGCLQPTDTVARLGGDEFALLLEDLADDTQAEQVAERIHRALGQPFEIGEHEVFSSASIGIALSSGAYERPEELLRDADTAMYRAKSAGRAHHVVFDRGMHQRALLQLKLDVGLHHAVRRGELVLHYQPIVDLLDGRVLGFEALLRWQHPEQGLLYPDAFLAAAEEIGVIHELGRWVLTEACRQMRLWQRTLPEAGRLAIHVNLHARQLADHGLAGMISEVLADTGLSPSCLSLEITENALLSEVDEAAATLQELRRLGVDVSLDDFGTGYSSFTYLLRFPVTRLKIDRSFIAAIHRREEAAVVEGILSLAQTLGLDVIAEGLETPSQFAALVELGCEQAQGYLFSRAVAPGEAAALIGSDPPWLAHGLAAPQALSA